MKGVVDSPFPGWLLGTKRRLRRFSARHLLAQRILGRWRRGRCVQKVGLGCSLLTVGASNCGSIKNQRPEI